MHQQASVLSLDEGVTQSAIQSSGRETSPFHQATHLSGRKWQSLFNRLARGFAAGVFLIGLTSLAGWIFNFPLLKSGLPGQVTMKTNAAIGFVLLGISLWRCAQAQGGGRGSLALSRVCAGGVVALALLTLAEHRWGWDAGIDQWLMRETDTTLNSFPPNRMVPASAVCFLFSGTALLLAGYRRFLAGRTLLATAAMVLGFIACIGYLYGVNAFEGMARHFHMAFPTGLGFFLLGLGIVLLEPGRGISAIMASDTLGGALVRRLLPALVGVQVVLGLVLVGGQRFGLYDAEFGAVILVTTACTIFCGLILGNIRWVSRVELLQRRVEARRRRAEEEVRQLNAQLEERVQWRTAEMQAAMGELEAFSYSVSHDLRAPLRAIDGYSGILLEDYGKRLDEEGNRLLGIVRGESKRMGLLIQELLAFSRMSQVKMEPVEIDMETTARSVIEELTRFEACRQFSFRVAALPKAMGDPSLIHQVWANLISNAVKFTLKRSVAEIEIGSEIVEGHVAYFIRDNGAGFSMEHADRLFGVFQRLHRPEEFEGTGVGLALVQRIVHRHRGRIWAQAEPEKGATFHFTLNTYVCGNIVR